MFEIYDKVKIKSSEVRGEIVDIYEVNGLKKYIIESDIPNLKDGYGGKWKLFDCNEQEIEKE